LDIHEDEVGLLARRHRDAALAVDRLDQLVAGGGQQVAHDLPVILGVLDHENALAHSITSSARARMAGGKGRAIAAAALRFSTSSKRLASSIGRSAGLAPFSTRST